MFGNFGQSTNIWIITVYVANSWYKATNYLLFELLDEPYFFHRMVTRHFDRKDILFLNDKHGRHDHTDPLAV